jgi:hypothetical protein
MRGPGLKTSLDVRRLWRCPACGYERRADGRLTTVRCQCAGGPFMQLVGEPRFQRLQNRSVDPYVDADEILGPPEPAPVVNVETAQTPVVDGTVVVGVVSETVAVVEGVTVPDAAAASTGGESDLQSATAPTRPSREQRFRDRGPKGPRRGDRNAQGQSRPGENRRRGSGRGGPKPPPSSNSDPS